MRTRRGNRRREITGRSLKMTRENIVKKENKRKRYSNRVRERKIKEPRKKVIK